MCLSDLRLSINGKDVPEDVKARLLKLHEENIALKEQLSTTQSKLTKAKAVSLLLSFCVAPITEPFSSTSSSNNRISSSERRTPVQTPDHL